MTRQRSALALCALLALPGMASPQRAGAPAGVARIDARGPGGGPFLSADSAWWAPLSSTLLPGLGQVRLRQNRFVAYLAIEAYALMGWATREAAVRREGDRYRGLARDIARAFVANNTEDGDWAYYEAMSHYLESGVYDRNPGGLFSPETDPTTFNGELWLRARDLSNWGDQGVPPPVGSPEYEAAINYYKGLAILPPLRWSWRSAQLEWHEYRQSIRHKNEASREARQYLALVAINHLLSTVDAYITVRLRGGLGAPRGNYRLTATLPIP